MATLTRRNVGGGRPRSSSLWEQEADNYWQEMEPARKYKNLSRYVAMTVLSLLALGGAAWSARFAWTRMADMAALKDRFVPLTAVQNISTEQVSGLPDASSLPAAVNPAPATGPSSPHAASRDPATIDLQRARCRVRGVQTRWHEETCRKLCIRDPQNAACMNGCSYGSITVTKATCDQLDFSSIPTAQRCPEGVNCFSACRAYENEPPIPATRISCERACTNVVPSSCSRILQIYRDLVKGSLQ